MTAQATTVLIDYGSGNLHSAQKAFERAANDAGLNTRLVVTADPDAVLRADRIVLPGVGAFADCFRGLKAIDGMLEALQEAALRKARPFLGICVGMQLLATRGLEHGASDGLGWIEGEVSPILPADPTLKIPHMGWNTLKRRARHPLLANLPLGESGLHAYFVHSYCFNAANPRDVLLVAEYGGPITAAIARGTICGVQFHPEKSQMLGLRLLANFLRWAP